MPRPYYGPRFYRVTSRYHGKPGSVSFDRNRSAAVAEARRLTELPSFSDVALETLDDRYPANVLDREPFDPIPPCICGAPMDGDRCSVPDCFTNRER